MTEFLFEVLLVNKYSLFLRVKQYLKIYILLLTKSKDILLPLPHSDIGTEVPVIIVHMVHHVGE